MNCQPVTDGLLQTCLWAGALVAQASVAPFEQQQLTSNYYTEGANVGDFNRDGLVDVVAGPFWWQGPDFTLRHTIYPPVAFPIGTYTDHFCSFVHDMNGDGWPDVITVGFPGQPALWYENPQTTPGLWPAHVLFGNVGTESPTLAHLVGEDEPNMVCGTGTQLGYLSSDPTGVANPWVFHPIATTAAPLTFAHGLGIGDIDSDGRRDLLTGHGWYEQPPSLLGDPPWQLHPWSFGVVAGAQMFAYDVDGDGDQDLITSRDAHGYGLSWFEHTVVAGSPVFVEHVILPNTPQPGTMQFSQLHALELSDFNGDGLLDIVTGKTFWAHLGTDPGALDPAVLYWFELRRTSQGVTYTPHLVHDDSGVGRQVVAADVNHDGLVDIVVGSKKGVSVFRRRSLWTDVSSIPIAAGGRQRFSIDAGQARAGQAYMILGSLSGTAPGIFAGNVHIPLNFDGYTSLLLAPGALFTARFHGTLGQSGTARAQYLLPGGLAIPPLLLHHACVVLDPQATILSASPAVRLSLL